MASVERRSGSPRPQVHYLLGNRLYSGDLVFHGDRPMLVISWRSVNWRRVPYVCFPLDADKLKPSSQPGVYVYEGDLTVAVERVSDDPQGKGAG
jgi:hypothetical protein